MAGLDKAATELGGLSHGFRSLAGREEVSGDLVSSALERFDSGLEVKSGNGLVRDERSSALYFRSFEMLAKSLEGLVFNEDLVFGGL